MFLRQAVSRLRHGRLIRVRKFKHGAEKLAICSERNGGNRWSNWWTLPQWSFLCGQAVFLGACSMSSLAEDITSEPTFKKAVSDMDSGPLRNDEDRSLISNEHTSKWRIFTDSGRDYFLQGNMEQAEKFFTSALQEAKEGFGERDPHVAAAYNNLAELLRIRKFFEAAELLYVEAVKILEENYGEADIRVGAAVDNFAQFYVLQRKLEKAQECLERALKIKRRVLGEGHVDYAGTLYRLGYVLHLKGQFKDAEDLILDSIRILEDAGEGDSLLCIKRMRYLSQEYIKTKRFAEAEVLLRKILHMMELSKGWRSFETNIAAEQLAVALQAAGKFKEAEELLERSLNALKGFLPHRHIQNAAVMINIARGKLQISDQLMKTDCSKAMIELDMAKSHLQTSIRISQAIIDHSASLKRKDESGGVPGKAGRDVISAVLTLLRSLEVLVSLEISRLKLLGFSRQDIPAEAEADIRQCISYYKVHANGVLNILLLEFFVEHFTLFPAASFLKLTEESTCNHPLVKAEYLSCLRRLNELIGCGVTLPSIGLTPNEISDEIKRIESEITTS